METRFSEGKYNEMIEKLFTRFPSFQKAGASAYKPGIANMGFVDSLMGHPHRNYSIIHVAGTNGKGSVSNMLASALSAWGLKVGLYTSPHILDFRERIRCVEISPLPAVGRNRQSRLSVSERNDIAKSEQSVKNVMSSEVETSSYRLVSREYVWEFMKQWRETFDHLDLSFFEITTVMALQWFADEKVDIVVLETGLGGRLDSTNIVTPILSVITNIGLDHCDMLGETLPEIAFEKAGIIKPCVPIVVGESHPETDPVFERKVLYTNLPEPSFAGDRKSIMSLLTFADKIESPLWLDHEKILEAMDLQGAYQQKNLRTVLAALSVLGYTCYDIIGKPCQVPTKIRVPVTLSPQNRNRCIRDAIIHTAERTGFRGRWEKISDSPLTICDIGHNEHGLRHNFAQLHSMKADGRCTDLIIVYGSVADKDVDAVLHLMPQDATYIFTQAHSKRALAAEKIYEKYAATGRDTTSVHVVPDVPDAVTKAREIAESLKSADPEAMPLIYVGGSTYVVSEAVTL